MKSLTFILLICSLTSISYWRESNKKLKDSNFHLVSKFEITTYDYDSLTIPLFFSAVIQNHLKDFFQIDSTGFYELCLGDDLDSTDSLNVNNYFTLKILHDLFTCQTASDCSKGEILDIPYFWHWIDPNPRHEIFFAETNQALCKSRVPIEFSKYASFADIDRTPYLFLSDLVQKFPKYYSSSCDTFSTFGWCSEREMAFIALATLLELKGKVFAESNHSWSEFLITMKKTNGGMRNFTVGIDNTFNSFKWSAIDKEEIARWSKTYGNSGLARWYNSKAKSSSELQRIKMHLVDKDAAIRIEHKIVEYLKLKLSSNVD